MHKSDPSPRRPWRSRAPIVLRFGQAMTDAEAERILDVRGATVAEWRRDSGVWAGWLAKTRFGPVRRGRSPANRVRRW